jgi:hypothetical protein
MVGVTAGAFTFGVPEYGPAVIGLATVGLVLGGFVLIRRRTTLVGATVGVSFSIIAIVTAAVIMGISASEAHESELSRQRAEEQIPDVSRGQPVAAPDAVACVAGGRLAIGAPGILTLDGEPQWQVTVDRVTLDATDQILAFDETNRPPRPRLDNALATVTLSYLGDEGTGRARLSLFSGAQALLCLACEGEVAARGPGVGTVA